MPHFEPQNSSSVILQSPIGISYLAKPYRHQLPCKALLLLCGFISTQEFLFALYFLFSLFRVLVFILFAFLSHFKAPTLLSFLLLGKFCFHFVYFHFYPIFAILSPTYSHFICKALSASVILQSPIDISYLAKPYRHQLSSKALSASVILQSPIGISYLAKPCRHQLSCKALSASVILQSPIGISYLAKPYRHQLFCKALSASVILQSPISASVILQSAIGISYLAKP